VGIHLLMGETAPQKFANLLTNLEGKRVRVAQALLRRS
jgi:hypothetical protein